MSRLLLTLALLLAPALDANAGAFVLTDFGTEDPDRIVHPMGYNGVGGALNVTLCIDPSSAGDEPNIGVSLQNIARTFTNRTAVTPNLIFSNFFDPNNDSTNVPFNDIDFESVAVHEIGHCLGIDHTNMGSPFNDPEREFAATLDGPDGSFDFDDGADNIPGTADDLRDDDINLVWFFKGTSNPFTIFPGSQVVDSTTYSRDLADLPGGDNYTTAVSRLAAGTLGDPNNEAVMKQLTFNGEEQRELSADDVATLRMAMSGTDETEGTSDDYTFTVSYIGVSSSCDIRVQMTTATGFARCNFSFPGASSHTTLSSGSGLAEFNPNISWFYNDVLRTDPAVPAFEGWTVAFLAALIGLTLLLASRRKA